MVTVMIFSCCILFEQDNKRQTNPISKRNFRMQNRYKIYAKLKEKFAYSNFFPNRCRLQNPVSHTDSVADISCKNQSGIAGLNVVNRFQTFAAA